MVGELRCGPEFHGLPGPFVLFPLPFMAPVLYIKISFLLLWLSYTLPFWEKQRNQPQKTTKPKGSVGRDVRPALGASGPCVQLMLELQVLLAAGVFGGSFIV